MQRMLLNLNSAVKHFLVPVSVNTSIIHHVENYPAEKDDFYRINEIELEIEGIKNKQYISNSLWQCYRGSGFPVIPTLLKIMHMALEKFLLEECENDNFGDVEKILKKVLLKSKSASLTAGCLSYLLKDHAVSSS